MGKDKNSNSRTKLLLTGVMAAAVILLIVLLFGFFDLGHRIALLTYTKISTYEDLKAISNKPDGKYYLACDIDMAGIEWTPVTFNGTLDGNGHAIKNLRLSTKGNAVRDTYDGNMKSYQTTLVGNQEREDHQPRLYLLVTLLHHLVEAVGDKHYGVKRDRKQRCH